MLENYLKNIINSKVYGAARQTPLDPMPQLSDRFNNKILLKREDLQPVFSFKIRGAYNKISSLSAQEKARGIIAASAGNHAQGVALSAQLLKLKATIVMPVTTPDTKVNAVSRYGAKVILYGDTFDQTLEHCLGLQKAENLVFIAPYDDPDIIAGQGTIGLEILQQISQKQKSESAIDAIFVPVGGGGLIAGIAAVIKYLQPSIQIIGVEPEDAASATAALAQQRRIVLDHVGLFADGVAVKQVGAEPFKIIAKYVDRMITVNTDEICAAIKDIFDDTRVIAEPAGALSVAGIKKYLQQNAKTGQTLVGINSGANTNFNRLRHITERAEIGEGKEALLAVRIPEKPGSFKRFCQILDGHAVTEFNYRYHDAHQAEIFVGIELADKEDLQLIIALLNRQEEPMQVLNMTDNEMAKLHLRHMIGGYISENQNMPKERVFRFEFPERPGALMQFLNHLGNQWNISLFHYRNHGAAYGRVLVGLQVPVQEQQQFDQFLQKLDYTCVEETANPAYQRFLI